MKYNRSCGLNILLDDSREQRKFKCNDGAIRGRSVLTFVSFNNGLLMLLYDNSRKTVASQSRRILDKSSFS